MFDDLRLACRRLVNAPTFTVIAVMTLALAIGAKTAIFSIADAVLFRPLRCSDPDHPYVLMSLDPKTGQRGPTTMTVHRGGDQAEWMETIAVTPGYLRVLGVHPFRGRFFDSDG